MATQRYISTSIWDDNWFIDELNASERLFYFYLLTNEHTNIAGIYKVSIRKMAAESCFSTNQVKTMLATFERTRKVYYRNEHIIMVNWPKHQKWHKLEKIHKGIRAILINQIPTTLLDTIKNESIPYQYPIDSLSDGINSLPIGYTYDTNYLDSNLDSDFNSDSDLDIDNKKERGKRANESNHKKFVKPTIEQVSAYCLERKNTINPQQFIDHYESIGWVVGKSRTPMKDWKATVRVWENNGMPNVKKKLTVVEQQSNSRFAGLDSGDTTKEMFG